MADIIYPGQEPGAVLNADAMPGNDDLVIYRGDYVEMFVQITNADGSPKVLTGYSATATLKTSFSDPNPVPISFACTLTGVPGEVRIYLSSTISASLAPGSYIWDFQITSPTGDARTYLAGDVVVNADVTI